MWTTCGRPSIRRWRPSGEGLTALIAEEAERQALRVLRASVSPHGLVASAQLPHYTSIWTRDLAFAALGANVSGDDELIAAVHRGLITLLGTQAPLGQIADAYWPGQGWWDYGESGSTDATALYVIAAAQHLQLHPDAELQRRLWPRLSKAIHWLQYQDANQYGLIDSPDAGDWMDSSLCRSGKVMYVNALYYAATLLLAGLAPQSQQLPLQRQAERIRARFNLLFWPEAGADISNMLNVRVPHSGGGFPHPASLAAFSAAAVPGRTHYLSHVQWGRFVDECDVLGNCLAVLFGLADGARGRLIMEALASGPAVQPLPARTYTRSFEAGDRWQMFKPEADANQGERWRNPPGAYHNGAVWPFIGGIYVAALQHVGLTQLAAAELERLAQANHVAQDGEWGFHEWLDAGTGEAGGAPGQCWSAGTLVFAAFQLRGGPSGLETAASGQG
jgi:glycogen debranching enzyme